MLWISARQQHTCTWAGELMQTRIGEDNRLFKHTMFWPVCRRHVNVWHCRYPLSCSCACYLVTNYMVITIRPRYLIRWRAIADILQKHFHYDTNLLARGQSTFKLTNIAKKKKMHQQLLWVNLEWIQQQPMTELSTHFLTVQPGKLARWPSPRSAEKSRADASTSLWLAPPGCMRH